MQEPPPRNRWQFSLHGLFVVMTAAAVYFALVANFPRLATAIGLCLFLVVLLYVADRLVAAGATPAGERVIMLITVFAWMLLGIALLSIGVLALYVVYGIASAPLGLVPWLIIAPVLAGGVMCLIAARNTSRRRRDCIDRINRAVKYGRK